MGEYFLIVNPVKRQYISADPFGENIKRPGIFRGDHGHAVGLLLCDHPGAHAHPLVGSWVGDPVIVTGDSSGPNTAGLVTTLPKDPGRDLYDMAKDEFEDISPRAMVMLFTIYKEYYKGYIDGFLYKAMWDSSVFEALQQIALSLEYTPLREALEKIVGPNWLELYPKIYEIRSLCLNFLRENRWLMAQNREDIPTFRVGRKIFAKLRRVDSRWSLLCQVRPETLARLVHSHPLDFFALSSDARSQGWIGTWIDGIIDWKEIAELLKESYRLTAPKWVLEADTWNIITRNIDAYIRNIETSEES